MGDLVMIRLEGFTERFNNHGHDTRIRALQAEDLGVSVLFCFKCERTAYVHGRRNNGWYLPATPLDMSCPGKP